MMMHTQLRSWGNSQGIRLNKEILEEAGVSVDDVLDVKVLNGVIMLTKHYRHKTLEERVADFGGELDLDGEFDWGEPVGREIW